MKSSQGPISHDVPIQIAKGSCQRRPADIVGVYTNDRRVFVDYPDISGDKSYLFGTLQQAPPQTTLEVGLARGVRISITLGDPA